MFESGSLQRRVLTSYAPLGEFAIASHRVDERSAGGRRLRVEAVVIRRIVHRMAPMASFVALLRAVNVGGTGKLPMSDLKAMCESIGFQKVRTYIASGNVVFRSAWSELEVKAALEARLQAYAGKAVGVAVRTAAEIAEVLAQNPFPGAPGNRVVAIFLDEVTSPAVGRCGGACGR
jgi:hypothetical protein